MLQFRRNLLRLLLWLLALVPLVFGYTIGVCALLCRVMLAAFLQGFALAYHGERE